MSTRGSQVTLMIITDVDKTPTSIKFSRPLFRLLVFLAIMLFAAIVIGALSWSRLASHSLERDSLIEENEHLREYNARVIALEKDLIANRRLLNKMAAMVGADFGDLGLESYSGIDSLFQRQLLDASNQVPVIDSLKHPVPYGLPLDGWISQVFRPLDENPRLRHNGIDIAVGIGNQVLATADGIVRLADWDSTFGWIVILQHEDGFETVYGHNDTLLVVAGQELLYGEPIALSGNTGVSTAPHLHYEIRENGKPVDPEEYYVQE